MKKELVLHLFIVVLETIAVIYLLAVEGPAVFRYYTVLSNMLMLAASAWYLSCFFGKKEIPVALTVLHLSAAVCLTVTFLIAAFVLMPQSTFAYYFLDNVAPILHFIGPVLSVVTLMLSREESFSLVVLELGLLGRPSVLFEGSCGIQHFIQNNVNSILVPYLDTDAVVDALYRLYTDRDMCFRLGQQLKDVLTDYYTTVNTNDEIIRLLMTFTK